MAVSCKGQPTARLGGLYRRAVRRLEVNLARRVLRLEQARLESPLRRWHELHIALSGSFSRNRLALAEAGPLCVA